MAKLNIWFHSSRQNVAREAQWVRNKSFSDIFSRDKVCGGRKKEQLYRQHFVICFNKQDKVAFGLITEIKVRAINQKQDLNSFDSTVKFSKKIADMFFINILRRQPQKDKKKQQKQPLVCG